ncbi:collagen alpha-1(III) chain [Physeter macrocephalus]|uniref:Collagen alpha-1(III) chain n=1 Tax=Physeter macrocephalus TaxID=9755 RepID=A0A2Y9S6B7_PHYMC|nr:collagen alpha-1(III) chain [Physeter catodon]|eukprot:XP_023972862.1 collagen alpha-1(III) chain [Physeter catodon]
MVYDYRLTQFPPSRRPGSGAEGPSIRGAKCGPSSQPPPTSKGTVPFASSQRQGDGQDAVPSQRQRPGPCPPEPEAPHRRQTGEEVTARHWAEGPNLANGYSGHGKAMAGFTKEKRLGCVFKTEHEFANWPWLSLGRDPGLSAAKVCQLRGGGGSGAGDLASLPSPGLGGLLAARPGPPRSRSSSGRAAGRGSGRPGPSRPRGPRLGGPGRSARALQPGSDIHRRSQPAAPEAASPRLAAGPEGAPRAGPGRLRRREVPLPGAEGGGRAAGRACAAAGSRRAPGPCAGSPSEPPAARLGGGPGRPRGRTAGPAARGSAPPLSGPVLPGAPGAALAPLRRPPARPPAALPRREGEALRCERGAPPQRPPQRRAKPRHLRSGGPGAFASVSAKLRRPALSPPSPPGDRAAAAAAFASPERGLRGPDAERMGRRLRMPRRPETPVRQ